MEIHKSLPDFQEVVGLLDKVDSGTNEDEEKAQKIETIEGLDVQAMNAAIARFGESIYRRYIAANETSQVPHKIAQGEGFSRHHLDLDELIIDTKIPIFISAKKIITVEGGSRMESVQFSLKKGSEQICSIDCTDQGESGFEINDRYVSPKFRKQNFGTGILKAAEGMTQASANDKKGAQTVFASAAQLDVIYWFWKNGYRPKTDEDTEKLQKVLNGDHGLYLTDRYYVFDKSTSEELKYATDKDTGEYILRQGRRILNHKNAFRIAFQKTFSNNKPVSDIDTLTQDTQRDILDTTSKDVDSTG